jgi:ABC-2 type transport system ATP-binding protein
LDEVFVVHAKSQYAIETISLTKTFCDWWGRNKVFAVDDLNLGIRHNEVFGLLGPNGSGKTTTIKMLFSLLNPTKGKAMMLGGDSRDPKINSRIGYLPEESYLYKYLSARETLNFYGNLFGLPSEVRKMRIEALLEMVGLQGMANRPVGTFSKGMARRIGLAQALINDPDLLILDEPTTGLDPIGTRQIKDLLIQLTKRGKTILLCSHLLADVEDVCDRIAILYGGKLQTEGRVRELLQQTGKTQITMSGLSRNAAHKIEDIARGEDGECEITTPMDRLESFFIRIVSRAQQENLPTSGAVSTTQIGGFLAAEDVTHSILDKLVAEPIPAAEAIEPPQPVQTVEVVHDNGLLQQLTKSTESPKTEPVVKEEKSRPQPVEPSAVKRSVLEELTGGLGSAAGQDNKPAQGR